LYGIIRLGGKNMRIIGIDPGYAIMGWGVIDMKGNHFDVVAYDSIFTDKDMPMPDRLKALYTGLMNIIAEYEPEVAAIEELFFNNNAKTAILVGQARGVALLACSNSGLEIAEYTPLQIKQALVGYGRADKKQVQFMVKTMLNLPEVPKPDDTADALAAAICHGHSADSRDRLKRAGIGK
jgi:crossover junction endodeoxyribonuclease RuvC